jgi:cardiolipin synthase
VAGPPEHPDTAIWAWSGVPRPSLVGGNAVALLQGGDDLFPRLRDAIARARHEVWFATYIFHEDDAARAVAAALADAARRGVAVHVVVDGFGSLSTLPRVRDWLQPAGVRFEVFRALDRWWSWLQPGQLRRLHQKLCAVDGEVAHVGGINVIDDRHDINHGWGDMPRLDFAVEVRGPLAAQVQATARAMWARANLRHVWREEFRLLARSTAPVDDMRALLQRFRGGRPSAEAAEDMSPVRAAFVVRDNVRQRRAIERSYVTAIRGAEVSVDIAVPYFYPGTVFRRALVQAARRGVRVRLLLQGKHDYRLAAWAARALYEELGSRGVRLYEYMPAFLHAKVAVIDGRWATVGSSNIDPLSLLLNLEANVVVEDEAFAADLEARLESAFAASREADQRGGGGGWRRWLASGFVAWMANVYLRVAGLGGRY